MIRIFGSLRETFEQISNRNTVEPPDPTERRKNFRVKCSLPVTVITNTAEALGGRTQNLSSSGMKLAFPKALKVGEIYSARLRASNMPSNERMPDELLLKFKVIWSRKNGTSYDLGVKFENFGDHSLEQVTKFFRKALGMEMDAGAQKRKTTRLARRYGVTYAGPDGKVRNTHTGNISLTGLKMNVRNPIPVGSTVNLFVEFAANVTLSAAAEVMRCRQIPEEDWFDIGLRFTTLPERDKQALALLLVTSMKENDFAEG